MFQNRITLDEYLAIEDYSLEVKAAFRVWLGTWADGRRLAKNWDRLMWQWIESKEEV